MLACITDNRPYVSSKSRSKSLGICWNYFNINISSHNLCHMIHCQNMRSFPPPSIHTIQYVFLVIKSGVVKKNSRAISNILVLVLQIYQNIPFGNTTSPTHKMGHLYGFMNPQPPLLCCQGTLLLLPINLGHNLINIDIMKHLLHIQCNKISK